MTRVTGKPIDRIMKSFVDQPGAPVLTVRTSCTGNTSTLTLTEQRFVGAIGGTAATPQTWTFPACFKTNDAQPRCQVIDRPTVTTPGAGCDNVFANADARGYYLTEYTPEAVRALARSAAGLRPAERLSLAGDEWWMVRSGRHDADVYMDVAAALATDETGPVLSALAAPLAYTGDYLVPAADRARYQAWVRARFGSALRTLGFPGNIRDDDQTQSRRAALLSIVGRTGNDRDLQRQARDLAVRYVEDPASLSPTLAPTVLKVAALSGDRALYELYVGQLDKLQAQPEEFYRFFNALPWFTDPALVQRTLEYAMSPEVRSQDTPMLIGNLLASPWGRDTAWAFTKAQWKPMSEKLGVFQGLPQIASAVGGFCTTASAAELRTFFARNPLPSSARTLQQALERVDNCAAMTARQSPVLARWLASYSGHSAGALSM
jgi:aminopeptidase N